MPLYTICSLSQGFGLVSFLVLVLLYLHNIVQESTDTVKKFISTILPHEREEYVSSPFDQGTHLITTVAGVLQVSLFLQDKIILSYIQENIYLNTGAGQGWGAGASRSRVFLAPWRRSRLKKEKNRSLSRSRLEKSQEPEPLKN